MNVILILKPYGYVGGVCWQGLRFEVLEYIEEEMLLCITKWKGTCERKY